jgi:hypothetical protein
LSSELPPTNASRPYFSADKTPVKNDRTREDEGRSSEEGGRASLVKARFFLSLLFFSFFSSVFARQA